MREHASWDAKYVTVSRDESLGRVREAGKARIVEMIRPWLRPGARVLEAGSGTGRLVNFVALATGAACVGIDCSTEGTRLARSTAATLGLATTFTQGDLAAMPFAAAAFDIVFSDSVIEHLPSPEAALAEIARVTRPGGLVAITTPNRLRPDGWDLYKWRFRPPYLQRSFFPWQLRAMLRAVDILPERVFGDTLVLPRNFQRRNAPGGTATSTLLARRPRGILRRLERAADRVWPAGWWVNVGCLGRKAAYES